MLVFKSRAVSWRFWEILSRFLELPKGFKGSVRDFAVKLNLNISDGFFYSKVLPILLEKEILVETDERWKIGYKGRLGKVYFFDKDKLSEFMVKENPIARRVYVVWVKQGDVDVDIL